MLRVWIQLTIPDASIKVITEAVMDRGSMFTLEAGRQMQVNSMDLGQVVGNQNNFQGDFEVMNHPATSETLHRATLERRLCLRLCLSAPTGRVTSGNARAERTCSRR